MPRGKSDGSPGLVRGRRGTWLNARIGRAIVFAVTPGRHKLLLFDWLLDAPHSRKDRGSAGERFTGSGDAFQSCCMFDKRFSAAPGRLVISWLGRSEKFSRMVVSK